MISGKYYKILSQVKNQDAKESQLLIALSTPANSEESQKWQHDLRGSVAAIRIVLQGQLEALRSTGNEKDAKKAHQLANHLGKVDHAVSELCRLLAGELEV